MRSPRPRDIALLRLVAQRIAGPPCATATDAVCRLTAVQAQDYPGAVASLTLRAQAGIRQGVEATLNAGEVVRSWPMRGTLHFVLAEAGLLTVKQRGYHFLWHLSQTGTLCYGPAQDGEQRLVLLDEWVPNPRRPEREEALGEWALRYFRGHGPATRQDFAWWTKLVAADVKTGLTIAGPQLERIEVDGTEYFMDPETTALLDSYRSSAEGIFLLPGFDEYMLGYQDRISQLREALPASTRASTPGR